MAYCEFVEMGGEMSGLLGTHGGEEKDIKSFGGETRRKETSGNI
jgi:hypothetical protein